MAPHRAENCRRLSRDGLRKTAEHCLQIQCQARGLEISATVAQKTAADLCPVLEDPSRLLPNRLRARVQVLRTVPCRNLPQARSQTVRVGTPCRALLDAAAPFGAAGLNSSSNAAPANTASKSLTKSVTTGASEATARRSPHSEFAFELVDQLRLPTTSSAVLSPMTRSAFAWCSPLRPAPTAAHGAARREPHADACRGDPLKGLPLQLRL